MGENCPECGTELYRHSDPGSLWCEECEKEYWQEGDSWYRCGMDGESERVGV